MKYTIKSGILYNESQNSLVKIKCASVGRQRRIVSITNTPLLIANICYLDESTVSLGDVRNRKYILTDSDDQLIVFAYPKYSDGDNPDVVGWPICRMPRVDHAHVVLGEKKYVLTMHNNQYYSLLDTNDLEVLRIMHKGIVGGWMVEDNYNFAPEIICGIFIFCRYIEQENEFLIV